MNIYMKLVKVQNELKAPKGQYNSFGKYAYRNQEDILEAVKPILLQYGLTLFMKDEIILIGDRYYVKATCVLVDVENGETIENHASARESIDKKGMDDSQITGSTSSYARKYALNGMFLIDDTKDADTDEFQKRTKEEKTDTYSKPSYPNNNQSSNQNNYQGSNNPASAKQLNFMKSKINEFAKAKGLNEEQKEQFIHEKILIKFGLTSLDQVTSKIASGVINALTEKQEG